MPTSGERKMVIPDGSWVKCKNCGQMLSVPRGKGRIRVTCPRCGTKVEKKS